MYKTMHNLRNRSKDKKGFTLAELLIVVAIIAILVAIAIPIFTGQLEAAREATDMANIRATYAEACLDALTDPDNDATKETVPMVSDGKFEKVDNTIIGGFDCKDLVIVTDKTCTVTITDGNVQITVTTP